MVDGGMNYGWMGFWVVFGVLGDVLGGWGWNVRLGGLGE